MVSNIQNGASFYGVLAYNQMKVERGEGRVLACNKMAYTDRILKFGELPLCLHTFEKYASLNSRMKKPVFHASLNPHPDDKLTQDDLVAIAGEYMAALGYADQPYIIYQHNDIKRMHLHIVSVRTRADGSKVDHNNEGRRSKAITEDIEKRWSLLPAEGSKLGQNEECSTKLDYRNGDVKRRVKSIVRQSLRDYKFSSTSEFNTLLNLRNVSVEEMTGTIKNKPFAGIMYGALDDDWQRVGKPFKSSLFGKEFGYTALQERYTEAKQFINKDPQAELMRGYISRAMSAPSLVEFAREIAKSDIEAVVRRNEQGRIYGITFIDHKAGLVANGSRLGKEFAAGNFDKLYGTGLQTPRQDAPPIEIPQENAEVIPLAERVNRQREAAPESLVVVLPSNQTGNASINTSKEGGKGTSLTERVQEELVTTKKSPAKVIHSAPSDIDAKDTKPIFIPLSAAPLVDEAGKTVTSFGSDGNKTHQSPAPPRGGETDGNDIEQALESLGIFSLALDDAARDDYDPDEWEAMHQHKKKRKLKRKR